MRALIAEYDFISRRLLEKILSSYGKCDCVDSGKKAYEKFKKSLQQSAYYDLLIIDAILLEINSIDLLDNIRSLESHLNDIRSLGQAGKGEYDISSKIILTTAAKERNRDINGIEDKFDVLLQKPIDKEKIINEIRKAGLI